MHLQFRVTSGIPTVVGKDPSPMPHALEENQGRASSNNDSDGKAWIYLMYL